MERNDSVSFVCEVSETKPLAIVPLVNEVSLTKLISEFEKAQNYEPVGGYGGIVPQSFNFGPLESYFLGEYSERSYWATLGAQYILGCECGEVGCWPLQCHIQTDRDFVKWERFKQPHREERDYSCFGPFVFDAAQYRDALARLIAQIAGH